jgi:hypothetical protein
VSYWEAIRGSDDWFTPAYVFEALGETFDLDVAAPPQGPLHVPCWSWISSNSLERAWQGFVWMNSPFEGRNGLRPWMQKFFDHGSGIALTPDRTNAPWFQEAWRRTRLVLFAFDKVKFIRPDGSIGASPGYNTTLWAAGQRAEAALRRAAANGLGFLAQPAQGIEAGTAETAGLGAQHESPVP